MLDRVRTWFAITEVEIAVLLLAAIVVGLLAHLLVRLVARRLLPESSGARGVFRRVDHPIRVLLPLLACAGVLEHSALRNNGSATADHAISLLLIGVLTWLSVRFIAGVEAAIASHNLMSTADNLHARSVLTQTRVLGRTAMVLVALVGIAAMLMTFPGAREIGTSLLASAGLAGLVAGFAARQVLSNLLAGVQIAVTQPIRIDDVLVVEGEWGRVEEIGATYVVVRIWDDRRLVVPLEYFISKPFENWTRKSAQITGTVFIWADYSLPVDPVREELARLCKEAKEWDGRICTLQVTAASERAVQLRALVSSADSSRNWDLRCRVREGLITFIAREYPAALPRLRADDLLGEGSSRASS